MSERINVDHAFDPEARKAQAEFDAYIDSRPTEDLGPDDAHYEASLNEGDYSNESLEQLAQRVADARAEGDKTRAGDAEEAFFNKFAEYSEKYGWEEDDSANETASVNHADVRDRQAGRSTIDDRLERYSKIMYGDDASEERVEEARHEVEQAIEQAETADEVNAEALEADSADVETDDEPEAEASTDELEATPSIDDEIEAAKARLNAHADARAAQVVADMNDTDQAKADRELLEPVSTEGLDPIATEGGLEPISVDGLEPVDEPNEQPALEGESLEEYEARNGGETDSDDSETAELEAQADEDGYVKPSRWQRVRNWLSPAGASANMAALSHTQRERLKEKKHGRAAMIVGGLAVAGAGVAGYLLLKNGGHDGGSGGGNWLNDLFGGDNDTTLPNGTEPTGPVEPVEPPRGGNGLNWNDFDPSARNVSDGEGWYSTFQQMGIPEDNWSDILRDAGPKLGDLGEAYYDNSANEWRISSPGRLSPDALRVINAAAKRDGVDLAA